MRPESCKLLDEVVLLLQTAPRVTVLTGAGISAESGVPTFRGSSGLWRNYRHENLATFEAFSRNPVTVWEWYEHRRQVVAQARPNEGHRILSKWEKILRRFSLITQNVDGLHEQAGSTALVPLHGSIWELQCLKNCIESPAHWTDRTTPLDPLPPLCPGCGGIARPNVVWFGESLDPKNIQTAIEGSLCDVFLSIGTSAVVRPASEFVKQAKRNGAISVELNLDRTVISEVVDITVQESAVASLLYLDAGLNQQ